MTAPEPKTRDLHVKKEIFTAKFLLRWETFLFFILIGIVLVLIVAIPDLIFTQGTMQAIIRSGMDLSFMVIGMTMVLLIGEIDVSVGSIMIVSCTVMGLLCQNGAPDVITVTAGIVSGALCGLINGLLIAKCKMPSVIVTIATSMLFRGIVKIVLNVNTLKKYPDWYAVLSWQDLGGVIPYSALLFLIAAAVFAVVLHKTGFGRRLILVGSSPVVSEYSGIRIDRIRIVVFTLMGITAAMSGILFAGRLGGISSGMGSGYELEVIAIAVLGGVSTKGGKGTAIGPVIATFIMAVLGKTLDLLWVHANIQKIIVGGILLIAVLLPAITARIKARRVSVHANDRRDPQITE